MAVCEDSLLIRYGLFADSKASMDFIVVKVKCIYALCFIHDGVGNM